MFPLPKAYERVSLLKKVTLNKLFGQQIIWNEIDECTLMKARFKITTGCRRQPELLAHLSAIFHRRTRISLQNITLTDRPTEVKVPVML